MKNLVWGECEGGRKRLWLGLGFFPEPGGYYNRIHGRCEDSKERERHGRLDTLVNRPLVFQGNSV